MFHGAKMEQARMDAGQPTCGEVCCASDKEVKIKKTVKVIKLKPLYAQWISMDINGYRYYHSKLYTFGDHVLMYRPMDARVDILRKGEKSVFWMDKWIRPATNEEYPGHEDATFICDEWTGPCECSIYKFIVTEEENDSTSL